MPDWPVPDWPVPDFSTLCCRQKGLSVAIPSPPGTGAPHLLIGSTGSKAEGDGEWFAKKHGPSKPRQWRKVHLGIDADTLDIRAEHWKHIRTTNPMIRTPDRVRGRLFATVRHRTTKSKGCLSRQTALTMTHQLLLSAKKKWRKLDGQNRLPEIIEGIELRDGIKHAIKAA